MAINQLGFEQSATLIAALHAQVTGMTSIAPTDTASFISMAQATLRAGYEPVLNAIGQVLGRTLIAVRPYSRKFKGLEMSSERWGGITRKINFGEKALDPYIALDPDAIGDPTFSLSDGASIDQYVVKKPEVLQTVYVGQNVYESSYTIFTKQLDTAFSSPAEFGAFMSGLMTHFSNEREQYLESLSRAILCNMIGAKKVLDSAGVDLQIIDLLAEYNTATGQSLTATTVKLPANYPAFCKWAYAYIQHVSELFTERTEMYQRPLTSYHIMRHTPKADQRLYMDADFLAHMTAEVLADTYHDNFLRYSEVEAVNFWQAAKDPNEVNVTPVYLNADCEYVNATDPVDVTGIVGVLMDRDAAGYNLADDDLVASPYNAKGQYYNLYNHVRIQLQNDLTEKAVVFCIGGSVNPNPPVPSGTTLFEGNIVTEKYEEMTFATSNPAFCNYALALDPVPDSLTVTIGDTTVELPRDAVMSMEGVSMYGEYSEDAPVFTTYPCAVGIVASDGSLFNVDRCTLDTPDAGTYSTKIVIPDMEPPVPEGTKIYDGTGTVVVLDSDAIGFVINPAPATLDGIALADYPDTSDIVFNGTLYKDVPVFSSDGATGGYGVLDDDAPDFTDYQMCVLITPKTVDHEKYADVLTVAVSDYVSVDDSVTFSMYLDLE